MHCMIYCCGHFPGRGGKYFKYAQASRNWRRMNVAVFEQTLDSQLQGLDTTGVNSMWTEWRNKFLAALDEAVPKKIIKNNRKRKKHCPWMSPELLYLLPPTEEFAQTDLENSPSTTRSYLFFVTESWGTVPITFIDNSKTSIFKTNFMLIGGIPKHFGPQSITSPVGKKPIIHPRQCNCPLSLNTSSLFFTSLVLPMHFPLVQTKKMHCVHSLQ